jgi:hypothetical protein
MSNNIIYTGIFLDKAQQALLLNTFPPVHEKKFAHHMTTWFKGETDPDWELLPWGETITLSVVGYAEDEKAQAVKVDPPVLLMPGNGRIPHITISTDLGTKPVYSGVLIRRSKPTRPFILRGKFGWSGGGNSLHFNNPNAV